MKHYASLFIISLLSGTITVWAQSDKKKEVEISIDQEQMPESATASLSEWLSEAQRIRFYQETDGDQISYEAKLRRKGKSYSVEFYEDGSLMDIEQLISYALLPEEVRHAIGEYLTQTYDRHQVRRVQKQYSTEDKDASDEETLKKVSEEDNDLTVRYELVVEVRRDSEVGSYELLLDDQGNFLQERKIVRRSLDNILY